MSKTVRILFISLVLTGLVLSACAPAPTAVVEPTKASPTEAPTESAPIKLKVAVFNYLSNAPLFIARDEGYYAEQGLDVELVEFTSSSEIVPALLSGQIDIGANALSVGMFNAIAQGDRLMFVADKGFYNPENCTTDAFVISSAMGANGEPTADDIKGKVIVFPPGDVFEYMADTLLASYGLTQADVKPTSVADSAARIEGLKTGSIDISLLSEPWITRAKDDSGAVAQWPLSKIAPGLSGAMIVAGPTILDKNPEAGVRFMAAYIKAVKKFNEGKTDRNVEMIAGFTKLDPENIKASCWTSFTPDGKINTDAMMAFQEWGLGKGYITSRLDLDQVWDSSFIDQAMTLIK